MKVLLDTNVFIRFTLGEKLPRPVMRLIETSTEPFVSIITPWEIALKGNLVSRGREKEMTTARVEQALEAMGARLLPITIKHTAVLYKLPMFHRDPFDRMIIAQAIEERCPVLSAAQRFELYKGEGLQVIWN